MNSTRRSPKPPRLKDYPHNACTKPARSPHKQRLFTRSRSSFLESFAHSDGHTCCSHIAILGKRPRHLLWRYAKSFVKNLGHDMDTDLMRYNDVKILHAPL